MAQNTAAVPGGEAHPTVPELMPGFMPTPSGGRIPR